MTLSKVELLAWLKAQQYKFVGYYKYLFSFEAVVQTPYKVSLVVGGDADDVYKFWFGPDPMNWGEVKRGGDVWVNVTALDGTELLKGDLLDIEREVAAGAQP